MICFLFSPSLPKLLWTCAALDMRAVGRAVVIPALAAQTTVILVMSPLIAIVALDALLRQMLL